MAWYGWLTLWLSLAGWLFAFRRLLATFILSAGGWTDSFDRFLLIPMSLIAALSACVWPLYVLWVMGRRLFRAFPRLADILAVCFVALPRDGKLKSETQAERIERLEQELGIGQ